MLFTWGKVHAFASVLFICPSLSFPAMPFFPLWFLDSNHLCFAHMSSERQREKERERVYTAALDPALSMRV